MFDGLELTGALVVVVGEEVLGVGQLARTASSVSILKPRASLDRDVWLRTKTCSSSPQSVGLLRKDSERLQCMASFG